MIRDLKCKNMQRGEIHQYENGNIFDNHLDGGFSSAWNGAYINSWPAQLEWESIYHQNDEYDNLHHAYRHTSLMLKNLLKFH